MQIRVKNFGAIQSGEIDLSKKITLFCGPNCTGKTYMAYLMYALLSNGGYTYLKEGDNFPLDTLYEKRSVTIKISKKTLETVRGNLIKRVHRSLDSIFGLSEENAIALFKEFELSFVASQKSFYENVLANPIKTVINVGHVDFELSKAVNSDAVSVKIMQEDIRPDIPLGAMRYILTSTIYTKLVVYPIGEVAIFPVERNSVYTFSKELSIRKQEKWDQIQLLFEKEKRISDVELMMRTSKRYPLPIRENLVIADDIVEIKKKKSEFYSFAEDIERDLLHGEVMISNDGEMQFVPIRDKKHKMPIQITASIVKSMSSLIVYLKHIAQKNDLIIIDEPEINLHPANQIVLARVFAKLANVGFRLLISTHSDYIIREFNILLMGHEYPQIAKRYKYEASCLVDRNDISVYYFSPNQKTGKSEIEQVEITNYGFEVASIDKTIIDQNDTLEHLSYALNSK